MASLFNNDHDEIINLLEAGAGIGSLIIAELDKKFHKPGKTKSIYVTAYEIDRMLSEYLKTNLDEYRVLLRKKKIEFNYTIKQTDFIKDIVLKKMSGEILPFTHAIINPPYKKINSDSDHRKYLRLVHYETVNLYSAFAGLSILALKEKGELIAIIPRSFCNGSYYIGFRLLITEKCAIKRIHLFDSRNQAFKEDDVLQENIIIHLIKGQKQGDVFVSHSTDQSLADFHEEKYSFNQIVKPGDSESFIHIPYHGIDHLKESKKIKFTLQDLKLEVSTGPVVDFRANEHISKELKNGSVPLLYPLHFNGKEIDWPKEGKKPNYIANNLDTFKMLFPNGYYTVVKRFSSKEEKQRIIARVINPKKISFEVIGIENHLNVFHFKKKSISPALAYGLAAYLNSSFVDIHFRSFNGHTQVNATDLRQLRYPSLEVLEKIGKWAEKLEDLTPGRIDNKIKSIL